MRLETDMKLDFNNVLIRPKRTVLSSRSQVDLEREFKFPNTKTTWRGVLLSQLIWIQREHLSL